VVDRRADPDHRITIAGVRAGCTMIEKVPKSEKM
jgi:hypothetical protein